MYNKTVLRRKFRRMKVSRLAMSRKSLNHPAARVGFLGLAIVMGFLYVLQMNITATKGYDIRELEQKVATLEKEAKDLQLQALELQSMDRMVAQLPSYALEQARPDAYLATGRTVVASR